MNRFSVIKIVPVSLVILMITGCSQTKYTMAPSSVKKYSGTSHIGMTGETIGWDDIKRMPR